MKTIQCTSQTYKYKCKFLIWKRSRGAHGEDTEEEISQIYIKYTSLFLMSRVIKCFTATNDIVITCGDVD